MTSSQDKGEAFDHSHQQSRRLTAAERDEGDSVQQPPTPPQLTHYYRQTGRGRHSQNSTKTTNSYIMTTYFPAPWLKS